MNASARMRHNDKGRDAVVINPLCRSALVGLGVLLAFLSAPAHAQSNPKTITMVVPYAAGGGTDTVARLIGERMSRTLGQTIIIENVVGGGSTLANDRVARSAPDGSTVLINHVGLLAAPSLFINLRYDTKTAFEPVGLVNNAPMVLIGRKSIPGEGPKDYVNWIKAQGDKANFAHGGLGTNSHLCAVMMGNVLGFKPTVVAYRGSAPAIGDLLAGQIDLLWDQVTNALPQIQAGTLHGIAITSPQRLEQLKDVPTTAELGMPEVSYSMWHGLYVAKGTPKETINALNSALRAALAEPELLEKLKQLGTLPFPDKELTPEAHASLFAADLPRVAKLIESSGIKASEAK
ncbi:tripartite-type tricarboxylate transporter receptor subunit TctC [Bradyrhizobium sp. AZCC 2262]|uniref:Bug family tripartite tricarboxylate transporter substrate binding protein n=1 Tax=Bradyrhizobium sp. AZCC 2262 TaxID=3117022 RepID=UPI002FEF52E1